MIEDADLLTEKEYYPMVETVLTDLVFEGKLVMRWNPKKECFEFKYEKGGDKEMTKEFKFDEKKLTSTTESEILRLKHNQDVLLHDIMELKSRVELLEKIVSNLETIIEHLVP